MDWDEYDELMEYFGEEGKALPHVEKLAELIFQHAQKTRYKQFVKELDECFSIADIKEGELWLNEYIGGERDIGPALIFKPISELA